MKASWRVGILALACLSALASAATGGKAASVAIDIPGRVAQGGLLQGTLPPGSRLSLLGGGAQAQSMDVRVSANGRFVAAAGRDETGPIQLTVILPDLTRQSVAVAVEPRTWRLERIQGVPEATVNPPPAIAARIEREQAEVSQARTRDDDRDDFSAGFQWPLLGRISGVYGSQRIYNGTPKSPHSGLDVAAASGTPLRAPAAGIISFAKPDLYLTGGTVLIDHGHGLSSNFLHLSRIDVHVGDRVEQGEVIGLVGATGRATGPHMHWGMNWFAVRVDPQLLVDPSRNPAAPAASATPSQ